MKRGMRFLHQLDAPNKQKSVGYDLNRTVPNLPYKSWAVNDWHRDFLAMGLYCCERDSLLLESLIEYYLQLDSTDICYAEWVKDREVEFQDFNVTDRKRRELVVLAELLPVKELTASIAQWFPERQQTDRHTLLMLHFCGNLVGDAMDNIKHHDELPMALLAVMRREFDNW